MPEGEGYGGGPADEREFPDLPPIRPSHARALDAREGGWQGQRPQPGQYEQPSPGGQYDQYDPQGRAGQPGPGGYGQGGYGGGYPSDGPGYGQPGPAQGAPGYGGQYGGQRGAEPVGPAPTGPGQAPWPGEDDWASQDWQAPAPAGQPVAAGPSQQQERPEEDVPSWAEPDSVEAFSARWHRRGLDSRDDRRTGRRKRRRGLFAIGGAAAVAIAVAVYFLAFNNSGGGGSLGFGSLVTQFLPGELQSVPDACNTVPSATLSQFLPGTTKQAAPPLNSGTDTECTWTLDNAPTYRVLEVQIVAYTPSALVANPNGTGLVPAGNGSATYAAEASLASSEYTLETPAANSGQSKATLTTLSGMPGGNDTSAFSATQVNNNGHSDVATVYVRYRNVIITTVVQGLNQTTGSKKYGPVSMSDLSTAATTVARQVAAKIV